MFIYIYIYIHVCIFIYIYTCMYKDTLLTCTDSPSLSPYARYFSLCRTCKHTAGESTDRLGHVEGVDYRDHHNYAESAVAEAIAQARRPLPRPTRAREPGRVADSLVHDVSCAIIRCHFFVTPDFGSSTSHGSGRKQKVPAVTKSSRDLDSFPKTAKINMIFVQIFVPIIEQNIINTAVLLRSIIFESCNMSGGGRHGHYNPLQWQCPDWQSLLFGTGCVASLCCPAANSKQAMSQASAALPQIVRTPSDRDGLFKLATHSGDAHIRSASRQPRPRNPSTCKTHVGQAVCTTTGKYMGNKDG